MLGFLAPVVSGIGDLFGSNMALPAIASVGSALIGSNAAQNAASTQAQSQQNALNTQLQMFNTLNQQQQPFLQSGYNALRNIGGGISPVSGGYFTSAPSTLKPFTSADLTSNLAPNYQFMLNQGLGANAQNFNAGGGGSNINRSNIAFAENYAGNAYQNALNNYLTQQQQGFNQQTANQTNIYNRLASLAGLGQTALGQVSPVTSQGMSTIGGTLGNIGTASAAGQIGSANALAGGLQGLGNYGLLSNLLGSSSSGSGSSGSGGGYFGGVSIPG